MKAILEKVEQEAPNIFTFWWRPTPHPGYLAGQYTELYLPHDHPDERGVKHWFTLSSSPNDAPLVSITTKFAQRSSTFKQVLKNLAIGSEVTLAEPMGDFILPIDATVPLIFVAGGIGITPYHSIIKYLLQTGERRDITLIYAVQKEEELIFQELWKTYPLSKYIPIVKEPSESWEGETGNLSAERILSITGPIQRQLLFMSGPEAMIESFNKELIERNVPELQLVGDYFPGYSAI